MTVYGQDFIGVTRNNIIATLNDLGIKYNEFQGDDIYDTWEIYFDNYTLYLEYNDELETYGTCIDWGYF